jgi:hypothetical protein
MYGILHETGNGGIAQPVWTRFGAIQELIEPAKIQASRLPNMTIEIDFRLYRVFHFPHAQLIFFAQSFNHMIGQRICQSKSDEIRSTRWNDMWKPSSIEIHTVPRASQPMKPSSDRPMSKKMVGRITLSGEDRHTLQ